MPGSGRESLCIGPTVRRLRSRRDVGRSIVHADVVREQQPVHGSERQRRRRRQVESLARAWCIARKPVSKCQPNRPASRRASGRARDRGCGSCSAHQRQPRCRVCPTSRSATSQPMSADGRGTRQPARIARGSRQRVSCRAARWRGRESRSLRASASGSRYCCAARVERSAAALARSGAAGQMMWRGRWSLADAADR